MCNLYDIGPVSRNRANFSDLEKDTARLVKEIEKTYVAPGGLRFTPDIVEQLEMF